MPKVMLKKQAEIKLESNNKMSFVKPVEETKVTIDTLTLQRILRKKRSKKYMEILQTLDAGGHVQNQEKVNELIEAIRQEFPEVELVKAGLLIGIVSKCYLGHPYEVHILDCTLSIVEHYKQGQTLPNSMEKARALAARDMYQYIEVYTDHCCAISSDGTVSII